MKIKRLSAITLAAMFCLMLSACGASQEQKDEAAAAISSMKEVRLSAETTYLDITDSTRGRELEIIGREADTVEAVDIDTLSESRAESVISQAKELTSSYRSMGDEFAKILAEETAIRQERAKHTFYQVYILNETGKNLIDINFQDERTDETSWHLLGEDAVLKNGYTLMGCSLDICEGTTEWTFICEDENGQEYYCRCQNFAGRDLSGKTVVLKLDPDSQLYEGTGTIKD